MLAKAIEHPCGSAERAGLAQCCLPWGCVCQGAHSASCLGGAHAAYQTAPASMQRSAPRSLATDFARLLAAAAWLQAHCEAHECLHPSAARTACGKRLMLLQTQCAAHASWCASGNTDLCCNALNLDALQASCGALLMRRRQTSCDIMSCCVPARAHPRAPSVLLCMFAIAVLQRCASCQFPHTSLATAE